MINYNKDYSKKNPSKKYKELVELYKELHSNSSKIFDGRSLIKFANPIRESIEKHNFNKKYLLFDGPPQSQLKKNYDGYTKYKNYIN